MVHSPRDGLRMLLQHGSLASVAKRLRWGAQSLEDLTQTIARMSGPGLVVRSQRLAQCQVPTLVFWLPLVAQPELLALAMAPPEHRNHESSDLLQKDSYLVVQGEALELRASLWTLGACEDLAGGTPLQRDWVFASMGGCWHAEHLLSPEAAELESLSWQAQCASSGINWDPYRVYDPGELAAAAQRPPEVEPGVLTLPVWAARRRPR